MKKFVLFLFLLIVAFGVGFEATRWNPFRKEKNTEGKKVLGNQFRPSDFPLKNRSFTIVVVGWNNGATVQKTLDSLFAQNYENYRVVYIDDGSNDGSYELARDLVYASDKLLQVTLVRNEERLGDLANLVRAVQSVGDEEIIAVMDGKDWLAHEWVLAELNRYYADSDLWLTYGQSVDFPSYKRGNSNVVEAEAVTNGFRSYSLPSLHLKTFYAGLFKKIQESDLIFQGKFLPASAELAYMIPMLEMAKEHFQFIPDILYICNREGLPHEEKETTLQCERFIRSLNAYQPLSSLELRSFEEKESL